jgi:hypothetical protein
MMPWMLALIGFVGGLGFGLMVAWDMIGLLAAGIGVAVLLAGAFLPNVFRPIFGLAVVGFLVAFVAAGGLSLL